MARSWLFRGKVVHTRLAPRRHGFDYPAFFLCFPMRAKAALKSRLFSLNRFNLFSYHDADHGDGGDGEAWARNLLRRHGVQADGDIWLHTLPRMLGFVFNPVSFWLCHDSRNELRAVIAEVNNTFGERHCYLLEAADGAAIRADSVLRTRKVFHVSPFFAVDGEYRFRFLFTPERRTVCIDYYRDGELTLKTAVSGQAQALDDRSLLRLFLSLGWSTLLVVLRIHWQALRLWLKGMTFHKKPLPPQEETSR
ncbi:MAG: hypothetical protein K0S46_463 [Moraxellaceae bacterium]|jgi:DUF1365 family protein|nr:hypothetical protein [Moraxellaceae bacterium]